MFELILKNLHDILMNEVHNKYLQSFLGVKDYCRFGYPKKYQATSEISEDGYPQYCRCEDPDKVYKVYSHGKPYVFTNHDVVHTTNIFCTNMIAISMLSFVTQCKPSNIL